jgi:hypothetical protein
MLKETNAAWASASLNTGRSIRATEPHRLGLGTGIRSRHPRIRTRAIHRIDRFMKPLGITRAQGFMLTYPV